MMLRVITIVWLKNFSQKEYSLRLNRCEDSCFLLVLGHLIFEIQNFSSQSRFQFQLSHFYNKSKQGQNSQYRLLQFKNQHRHSKTFLKNIQIEQFVKSLPKDMTFREYKKKMKKKFKIKKSALVYWLKKAYKQNLSFEDLLKQFDFLYYQFFYLPFDQKTLNYPEYLVIMTPKMKYNCTKYDQFIGFSVFKKISATLGLLKKRYELGIIMGLNCASQTIPLAITIVAQSDLSLYQMAFAKFFENSSIKPKVIITPSTPYICSIIKHIKNTNTYSNFEHLYQKHKVIKSVTKNLTEENRVQDFNELLQVLSIKEFQTCLKKIIPRLNQNDKELLYKFLQKCEKYCFSLMPSQFIGLNNSPSMSQQMESRISQQISYSKSYVEFILSLCKFLDKHPSVVWEVELTADRKEKKIQQNPSLKYLCEKLEKKAFEKFAEQYHKTNKIMILHRQQKLFKLELQNQIFSVLNVNGRWKCVCDVQRKTGLPCCHLLIAIFMRFQELQPYINPCWFIQNDKNCHIKVEHSQKNPKN